MDMDQAAVFLAGSILTALGLIVAVAAIIAINNLFHTYWKPVQFFKFDNLPSARFATEEELVKKDPK